MDYDTLMVFVTEFLANSEKCHQAQLIAAHKRTGADSTQPIVNPYDLVIDAPGVLDDSDN
jgi:hypothetical protein